MSNKPPNKHLMDRMIDAGVVDLRDNHWIEELPNGRIAIHPIDETKVFTKTSDPLYNDNMKITRKLYFGLAVIDGETVRDIIGIIPEAETAFTQRKGFDEYNWTPKEVDLTIDRIIKLNELFYDITITRSIVIIDQ